MISEEVRNIWDTNPKTSYSKQIHEIFKLKFEKLNLIK